MSRIESAPLDACEFQYPSLAEMTEEQLVDQLLAARHWRWTLFNIVGFPNRFRLARRVALCDLRPELKTDVDILLVADEHPENAIAIEVMTCPAILRPAEA